MVALSKGRVDRVPECGTKSSQQANQTAGQSMRYEAGTREPPTELGSSAGEARVLSQGLRETVLEAFTSKTSLHCSPGDLRADGRNAEEMSKLRERLQRQLFQMGAETQRGALFGRLRSEKNPTEMSVIVEHLLYENLMFHHRHFTMALNSLGRSSLWPLAISLLPEMRLRDLAPNTITYNAAVDACRKGHAWECALELFQDMEEVAARADLVTYSTVMSACEKASEWPQSLHFFMRLASASASPDGACVSSAVTACSRGALWELATSFVVEMRNRQQTPDLHCHNALITAMGNAKRWQEVADGLRLGRPLSETNWVSARDLGGQSQTMARELFEKDRMIEYQCYDDEWNEQGRGVLNLVQWEDPNESLFLAVHGKASDDYYDWYVKNELSMGALYHVCDCVASRCKKRKARGDHRAFIHVDKWRMLTPQAMVETPYLKSEGESLGRAALEERARLKAPQVPGNTGLDAALAEPARGSDGRRAEEEAEKKEERRSRDRRRGRSRSKRPRRRLEDKLAEQERKKAEQYQPGANEKGRKNRKKDKDRRRRRRKSSSSKESSSGQSSAGSSESLFRSTSVRGGELWRLAKKKPGRLTELSLREMSRYLAGQAEQGLERGAWESQKVLAYLNQIVLSASPPGKIGIRAHRELVTLATALDELLASRNLQCLDLLMQRFKAVQASITDGHWSLARHYELIPPTSAQLTREEERESASKAEVRHLKLAEAEGSRKGALRNPPLDPKGEVERRGQRKRERSPSVGGGQISRKREAQTQREGLRQRQEGPERQVGTPPKGKLRKVTLEETPKVRSSTLEWGDQIEDQLGEMLQTWLVEKPPAGLSSAQMASHLVLQIWNSPSPLQRLLEWNLQAPEPREHRVRNLFPLPLWHDDVEQLRMVLTEGGFRDEPGRWRERGETKSKAQKAMRLEGLKTWHALCVLGLNFLYGDREKSEAPWPGSQATAAQERALTRVWDMLKIFFDEKEKGGVPRTPLFDWSNELNELGISYTGEVVEKAQWVTLRQILPGLPSAQHGGLVDLLEVVSSEMAEMLKDPMALVRQDLVETMPKPRVMCEDDEWPKVVEALHQRGIVIPVDQYVQVKKEYVMNGIFGVPKQGKELPNGEQVLRLIIDLRASKWLLSQVPGDAHTLTGAASFQRILVGEEETLLVSGEDLTSAFYLFRLPSDWAKFMILRKPVPGAVVGRPEKDEVFVGLSVLPMGWNSSVAIMQSAHRRIALGSPLRGGAGLSQLCEISRAAEFPILDDGAAWSIYLDDTTIIEKVAEKAVADLLGKSPEEQLRLKQAYSWWGIPTNADKALQRAQEAERLGALIDGKNGALELISLGSWIRQSKEVDRKTLQIYAGKAVHILQFRRCLFSCLEVIFGMIAHGPPRMKVTEALRTEMLVMEVLLPLTQCNLRAAVDPIVTASDACESGGGVCFASRFTRAGEEEVRAMLEGEKPQPAATNRDPTNLGESERVLVIDLFAGIGGLTLSLKKAGLTPHHLAVVEKDADCRRLMRRTYPGADFFGDITKFGAKEIEKLLDKVPEATGIVAGGGSPCQGLSLLSSKRKHLNDERSKLFFDASRVFKEVEKVALRRKLWVLKVLENVVADEKDVTAMSKELKMKPVLVDAQYLSRARRPRLFWLGLELKPEEDVEVTEFRGMTQLIYRGPLEPHALFLEDKCEWPGGMQDDKLKFPTMTRCIPRNRPPPDPAGLKAASAAAVARWEGDRFRYPPYTYADEFMVLTPECELRPLKADEREILMGYQPGHTEKLLKKAPETEEDRRQAEDIRCSAIGNSFHTNAVACLLDHALATMGLKERKGAKEIVESSMAQQITRCQSGEPPLVEEAGEKAELLDDCDTLSVGGALAAEALEKKGQSARLSEELHDEKRLCSKLVAAFIRRQEYRGSDVRLDIGALYRPDSFPRGAISPYRWVWHKAHSFPYTVSEHINILELRSLVHTEWRPRRHQFGDCRAMHLTDSQVALAVGVKGRSSSRALNRLLRKFAALQVAGGLWPLLAYVESGQNPADGPSREYES
eukprot:s1827_g12.t1